MKEAPISKHQIPNKFQCTKFKISKGSFGDYLFGFEDGLKFMIWYLKFRKR